MSNLRRRFDVTVTVGDISRLMNTGLLPQVTGRGLLELTDLETLLIECPQPPEGGPQSEDQRRISMLSHLIYLYDIPFPR